MDNMDYRFFSPLFGREPEGDQLEPPLPDPSPWDDLQDISDVHGLPIGHFLPYLSQRTQKILGELEVKTIGDLTKLTRDQIFSCERGNETVVYEICWTIFDPKGLAHNLGDGNT